MIRSQGVGKAGAPAMKATTAILLALPIAVGLTFFLTKRSADQTPPAARTEPSAPTESAPPKDGVTTLSVFTLAA